MTSETCIPTLDFQPVNISLNADCIDEPTLTHIGQQLVKALFDVGFLYVINHGISSDHIEATSNAGVRFFDLPLASKLQRIRDRRKGECGYLPDRQLKYSAQNGDAAKISNQDALEFANERFDLSKPLDVKEVFDICHNCKEDVWPDKEPAARQLIGCSQQFITRLMLLLGHGLGLSDPSTFVSGFTGFSTASNGSQLRFLRYPAVSPSDVEPNQDRCGEHTDYGCMTLVYMDTTPGLQVYTRQGFYVDVEPYEGAILVNIGDLMQRWSGDELRSAKHRVIFRPDTYNRVRHSLVYFAHPDDDVVVGPVTGNKERYSSVRTWDHMHRRFDDTFNRGKGLDEELTRDY